MLVEPNALWSRVLRQKYCKGRCDINMFVPKQGMSNIWSGITENTRVLFEGMRMAVGNGLNTLFWDHKWVLNKPLSYVVTQPIPPELEGATVDDMWDKDFGWKWETFASYLNSDHLKMIQSFELKEDAELGDLVYWHGTPRGKFSIKSAISLMKNETDSSNEECWNLVWTAPIQQRQRAFLWLLCHDRLMDNNNGFKRKLTDDPKCFICGHNVVNSIHVLRDCPTVTMVWKEIGGIAFTPEFTQGDIKHWISYNLSE